MNPAAGAFLVAAGLAAAGDWVAVARRNKSLEYLCKPATLAALLAAAVALDTDLEIRRAWFVVALGFSLAGDVFLMLPRDRFVAGLASFLVGHVAYIVGFLAEDPPATTAIALASVAVAVAALALGSRVLRGVARRDRRLLPPVVAYMGAISTMAALAIASGPLSGAGAVSFFASDSLIAFDRFVNSRPWMRLVIMITYHVGQGLLVLSLPGDR